jgi:hypothetical protein
VVCYCPDSDETILRHLAQTQQNVQSTKPQSTPRSSPPPTIESFTKMAKVLQEVFLCVYPISKLYTDDMGRFPVRAPSGNQYVMIAYHTDGNLILQQAFLTKADKHCIPAFNTIIAWLAAHWLLADLNIRDNEASADFKRVITALWKTNSNLCCQTCKAERMIRHFKTTSPFLLVLMPHFHHTSGISSCPRPN